jgi:phosphotransferase system enzyme I (PtsI)
VMLRRGTVLGLVTDLGGRTGHTALVARSREIPTVVGTVDATRRISRGDVVAIDGTSGLVVVRPSHSQLEELQQGRSRYLTREIELMADRDLPAVTKDGTRVRLLGNIEFPEEVPSLLAHGGEGVGLHRTEFLYLHHRKHPPTEADHLASYQEILRLAAPHPVTIRTFDLGGDKVAGAARQREINPALGLRAIRFTLRSPELFRTQLRALLRASGSGKLRIMFPMISSLGELRAARAQLDLAREELAKAGEPVPHEVPIGIMVELPSAAAIADRLAAECDFFSVGTNDLIQYSMAIDRLNPSVAYLYRPLHLAILRTLEFVAKSAHDADIPVAMCGEMAGDPFYAAVLVGLGFDELSMSATSIPMVKRVIRALRADDARALVQEVMRHTAAEDLEDLVRGWMSDRFGHLMEPG